MGMCEGMCNGKAVAATVVLWGCWWQAHWERWQRWWRHGVDGEARYVFRHLDMDGNSGSKGGKAEEKKCKKEGEEKGKMVVEEKSPNKEGASGPAGFGPQAQSGEVHGRCKGPISGSMRDPKLQ